MKNKNILIILFVVFSFISSNITISAQDFTCTSLNCTTEPWEQINNELFMTNDGFIVSPTYELNKCCNGEACTYYIDISKITIIGNNINLDYDEIEHSVIERALARAYHLFNTYSDWPMSIFIKKPVCTETQITTLEGVTYTTKQSCDPNQCCIAQYNITHIGGAVKLTSMINPNLIGQTCPTGIGYEGCEQTACNSMLFTPPFDIPIPSTDPCLADCFWKIDGNENITLENFLGTTNPMPIIFKTNSVERMRINESGNVGINILNPLQPFEVKLNPGEINQNWTSKISFGITNDNPSLRLYRSTGTATCNGSYESNFAYPWWIELNDDWQTTGAYGALFFKSGIPQCADGNEAVQTKVAFLGNGNVGIGVENPQQKLVVDGTICAKEVRVSLSGAPCWPDYVFDKDYKILSLYEIEKYIDENKHLPNIPSAEDVVNNGIELGVMQSLTLQKIEEITLYLIELKKENNELNEKIKILENKLKEKEK